MGKLDGKVAIITGGSGGIGSAAAKLLAAEGSRILLVDLDRDALQRTVAEIGADQATHVVADVTDSTQTQGYVAAAVEKFGGVDIALLNAGIEGTIEPITDYPVEMFDKVIAVNVRGVFLGLKYVMPAISRRGGGSIVITSSTAGIRGTNGMSAYITSKHAVIGLMRSAALAGAEDKIRVNTVNPSPVETRMMRSLEAGISPDDTDAAHDMMSANIPLGRYAEPSDIANIMLFLASDESEFLTGGVYMADGGTSAR